MSVLLPTFGKPDEGHVGHELELEVAASAPRRPRPARRTSGARRLLDEEPGVALARPGRRRRPASGRRGARGRPAPCRRGRARRCPRGRARSGRRRRAPCLFLPWPCTPFSARRCGWSRKASSEATLRSATSQTSPPLPPSPPSGPPLATWASRRNETQPAPPSPPRTLSLALVDESGHGAPRRSAVRERATTTACPVDHRSLTRATASDGRTWRAIRGPHRLDARQWAATMPTRAHHRPSRRAGAGPPRAPRSGRSARSAGRAPARTTRTPRCAHGATRAAGAGHRARRGGARPVAHLLRARPRPHPARRRLPPPRRQDPGLRLPRRPPAHPAHPRPRGRPGGHGASPGPSASTWRSPRPSPSATTAATARAATPARTPSPLRARRLRPRRLGRRRHARPAQPVRRDARRHPQPLVVAARPGHARGRGGQLGRPHRLRAATTSRTPSPPASCARRCSPTWSPARCGATRRQQLDTFIAALVEAIAQTGRVGMDTHPRRGARRVPALQLRAHLPAAGVGRPGPAVVAVLRALVEHYADHPNLLPGRAGLDGSPRGAARRGHLRGRDDRPLRLRQAVDLLGWPAERLPGASTARVAELVPGRRSHLGAAERHVSGRWEDNDGSRRLVGARPSAGPARDGGSPAADSESPTPSETGVSSSLIIVPGESTLRG